MTVSRCDQYSEFRNVAEIPDSGLANDAGLVATNSFTAEPGNQTAGSFRLSGSCLPYETTRSESSLKGTTIGRPRGIWWEAPSSIRGRLSERARSGAFRLADVDGRRATVDHPDHDPATTGALAPIADATARPFAVLKLNAYEAVDELSDVAGTLGVP